MSNKAAFLLGDFNWNALDYDTNKLFKNVFNLVLQQGFLPLIQRPTRVTRTSATAIDHILTNRVLENKIESGIIKTDISNHFPTFIVLKTNETCSLGKTKLIKHDISSDYTDTFKFLLENIKWDKILLDNSPDKAYEISLYIFSDLYDTAFPKRETDINTQHLQSPQITRGLLEPSKRKQRLYEKFFKKRTTENETVYKKYKYLSEKIKKKSKTSYYQRKLKLFEDDIKKAWKIVKEVIEKKEVHVTSFSKNLQLTKQKLLIQKLLLKHLTTFL